jgi:hypothetical protein
MIENDEITTWQNPKDKIGFYLKEEKAWHCMSLLQKQGCTCI